MANPLVLAALVAKVNEYFGLVKTKLTEKAPRVAHAVNALKLNGSALVDMVATVVGYSSVHAVNKANPHGVTAEQTGSYSTADFNTMVAQRVASGIVPVSRYGTLSYLPAGVSGSFEGATLVKSAGDNGPALRESYNMQVEDNGTLTFLRNGTDGSTVGVYYGYVLNAVQGFSSSKVTITARRYRPPFVPLADSVAHLYMGGTGVLAGRLQDAASALGKVFLALTNNTLDELYHSEVWLDETVWEDKLNRSEVILGKDAVFILYNPWASTASPNPATFFTPLDFEMYTIPLSAFGSGQTVVPTKLVIGECTGFLGAKYTTGDIRLAAVAESKDPAIPALVQHIGAPGSGYFSGLRIMGGSGRIMTQSAFNSDGTQLRSLCYHDGRYQASGGNLQVIKFAYSWVVDMVTMKVTLDPGLAPMTIELLAGPSLKYTGTVQDPGNGLALANYASGDQSYRTYMTETGLIFTSRVSYGPTTQESLYYGKWNTFTSVFDNIKAPMASHLPETRQGLIAPLTYGSALGDSFDGFRLIPGNQCVLMGRNVTWNDTMMRTRLRNANDPLTYNYTYKSVTIPEGLEGFKPSTDRESIPAAERSNWVGYLQEMDDVSLKYASGTVLMNVEGFQSRYIAMGADMKTTGVVSATIAQLNTLRDEMIATLGVSPTSIIGNSIIELVIPRNPAVTPYAIVSCTLANSDRRVLLMKVSVSARSGAIATLTLGALIINATLGIAANGTGTYYALGNGTRGGSHVIYETDDSFIIVGNSVTYFGYAGGSGMSRYRFLLNKGTEVTQNAVVTTASVNIVGGRWSGLPGYGVGESYHQDFTTKLVFAKAARTKTEYVAWTIAPANQAKVLVSQEVNQGWVVYFTEDTPVIINGVAGVLSLANIDLTSIRPNAANWTFYVYVQMVVGEASYVIYDHFEPETTNLMNIGTVQTSELGISMIKVDKVTKFAGFRLSITPAGSSIPVTAGLPSREGHIDTSWIN